MRKSWVIAGTALILVGVAGLFSKNLSFGKPLPSFEKTWTFASGDLRDFNMRSDYETKVTFVKSTDGKNSVHVKGQAREKVIDRIKTTELSDGKLDLDMRNPSGIIFSFYHSNHATEEITVTLTDSAQLDKLGLHLDSDSLTLTDAQARTAEINVDSGNVKVHNLTAGKLIMNANSGSIEGNGIHADSTVHADSGSIKLEGVTGPAKLSANSGSVKLYRADNADTDIQADSGSAYVHLPASFAGSFDLKADSGSIRAPDPKRETKDVVKVRAQSGSIEIEQG